MQKLGDFRLELVRLGWGFGRIRHGGPRIAGDGADIGAKLSPVKPLHTGCPSHPSTKSGVLEGNLEPLAGELRVYRLTGITSAEENSYPEETS